MQNSMCPLMSEYLDRAALVERAQAAAEYVMSMDDGVDVDAILARLNLKSEDQ